MRFGASATSHAIFQPSPCRRSRSRTDECRSAGQMSEGALAPEFLSGRHSSVWRREPAVARSAMAGKTAGDHALGGRPLGRARGRAGCGAAGPATAGFDRSSGTAAREYWFLCSFKTSTRGSRPPTAPYSFPAKRVSRNAFLLAEGIIDGFVMTPKDQPSAFGTRLALPGPRAAIRGRDPGNFGSRQKVRRPAGRDPPAFKLLSQTKKPGGFAPRRRPKFARPNFGSNGVVPYRLARHSATRDGGFPAPDR